MTNELYNSNLKNAFIEAYGVAPSTLTSIFRLTAPMERSLNKDCSEFTLPEILILIRSFGSASVESLRVKICLLRAYTNFCIQRNFTKDSINHYDEITTKDYESLHDKRKADAQNLTENEVIDLISTFENPRDQYLILAPFEGIYGKDLCEICLMTLDDLLPNHKIKTCTGRILDVTPRLYGIMKEAGNTNFYISSEGKFRKLRESNYIYKVLDSKSADPVANKGVLMKRMTKMKAKFDIPTLGYSMLKRSGMNNALYKALHGEPLSKHYNDDNIQRILKRYDANRNRAKNLTTYNEYVESMKAKEAEAE